MDYQKSGNYYFLRLDAGEEIVSEMKKFCEQQGIRLGTIQAIGAVNKAIVGLYDPMDREYHSQLLEGDLEITSLLGNITTMAGQVYLHLHANLADAEQHTHGGHLNKAVVSATCEAVITVLPGEIERSFDDKIGINLLNFGKEKGSHR